MHWLVRRMRQIAVLLRLDTVKSPKRDSQGVLDPDYDRSMAQLDAAFEAFRRLRSGESKPRVVVREDGHGHVLISIED